MSKQYSIHIHHPLLMSEVLIFTSLNINEIVRKFFWGYNINLNTKMHEMNIKYKFEIKNKNELFIIEEINKKNSNIFTNLSEALLYISDYLTDISNNNIAFFHGALVANDLNQACCLIGKTMAGKTSLNLFLCKNGYKYLSDDWIVVNDELQVYSSQLPVKVRHGIMWDDEYYKKNIIWQNNDFQILVGLNSITNNLKVNLKHIFFIDRVLDKDISYKEVNGTGYLELLMNNISKFNSIQDLTRISSKIAKNISAGVLEYSELNQDLINFIRRFI